MFRRSATLVLLLIVLLWLPIGLFWTPADLALPVLYQLPGLGGSFSVGTWLTEATMALPPSTFDRMQELTVRVGERPFRYSRDQVLSEWRIRRGLSSKDEDTVLLTAPTTVRAATSALPWKRDVLNWPGDGKVFRILFPWELPIAALALGAFPVLLRRLRGRTVSPRLSRLARRIESASASFRLPHLLLLLAGLSVASVYLSRGGVLNPECYWYLPYHLSGRPLLQRLYDSKILDSGAYQARELSYLVDTLDVRFLDASVRAGMPHFLSLTHYLVSLLTALVVWRFSVRDLGMDGGSGACLAVLFLTAPCIAVNRSYYRTGKECVGLLVVLAFQLLYRRFRDDGSSRHGSSALSFLGLALAAVLIDRQGVFLVGAATAYLAARALSLRSASAGLMAAAGLSALLGAFAYGHWLAPALTLALNGYPPSFEYMHLPWAEFDPSFLWYGWSLVLDTVRFLSGNLPRALALVPLAAVLWVVRDAGVPWRIRGAASGAPRDVPWLSSLALVASLLALICLDSLMTLRHRPLLWPDIRLTMYWIPATAWFVMLFAVAVSIAQRSAIAPRPVVQLLLIAMIAGNVAAIPAHERTMRGGTLKENYELAPALIEGLRHVREPGYAPPPEVAQDEIYRFYRARLGPDR